MNHRLVRTGAAVLLAGSLLAACSGGSDSSKQDVRGPRGRWQRWTATTVANTDTAGDWTVLVYMAADNNLEGAALADLVEMGSATGTEFVVLLDRAPGYSSGDILGLGDFTDTVMLDVVDGEATLLDTPGELNMGEPAVLEEFVSYGLQNHPNDKTGLVIWDHGGSWKGAAWDETSGDDNLTVAEISTAVSGGLTAGGAEKLDMIGFDACLMATYEVASAVASVGRLHDRLRRGRAGQRLGLVDGEHADRRHHDRGHGQPDPRRLHRPTRRPTARTRPPSRWSTSTSSPLSMPPSPTSPWR